MAAPEHISPEDAAIMADAGRRGYAAGRRLRFVIADALKPFAQDGMTPPAQLRENAETMADAVTAALAAVSADPVTDDEWRILDLLAQATDAFAALPEHHPTDLREWAQDVHRLQYRIMARAAVRLYPDRCTPMTGGSDG